MYPEPSVHRQLFTGGMNSDLADEKMLHTMGRIFLNCRALSTSEGNEGDVVTNKGNVLISTPLPSGTCQTIGTGVDIKNNKVYFAVYNSNGYHTWYYYDATANTITQLLQNLTDTDGIDIFKWSLSNPFLHIDIVDGNLNYYCDGLNLARKFNIQKMLDKSDTGYGITISEDFITAYRACPVYAPVPYYSTDVLRNSNFCYANMFKFCYRFGYDDGEMSNYSDMSIVPLPPNQSYLGAQAVTTDNNVIQVPLQTGSRQVVTIEVAMKMNSLDWQTCAILNKKQLSIADNSNYVYSFYNDGSYTTARQDLIARPYNFIFRVPICQAFVDTAMVYTGGDEGFEDVPIDIGVIAGSKDLFVPSGTDNELNSPELNVTQLSYTTERVLFKAVRYNPTIQFIVGSDVKSGNIFTVHGSNGKPQGGPPLGGGFDHVGQNEDNYNFSYKANLSDTAISVANRIIAFLRGIRRGIPDATNGISGYVIGIDGSVTFNYSYLGQWRQNITKFSGSVNPVSTVSLMNNGVSVKVIKSGSTRQYAIGYENDIQQKSPSYTANTGLIRTPFLTESVDGKLQKPYHQISIMHQPPVWARKWSLYRTPDELDYIQLLVQQVIKVTVTDADNNGVYLDLVIGSLSTYNAIHKDSILKYPFKRGDRLRLIKNQNTGVYYTPFYETEILSYQEVTTELVNAGITVYGSDLATPADGVRADYIGKNIQIGGYERTIIDISGGDYVLDQDINIGTTIATSKESSYTFIDRRGIVRIALPPAGYDVVNFSTVELYTPQSSTQALNYKEFVDTGMKFDILNAGTATRAHAGTHQDQDGTDATSLVNTPAVIITEDGDAYIRDRAMPSNTSIVNTQVIVDAVEDPNFSDFFESNLNDIGRVYPTDPNPGVKHFGSRSRFSGNYIQDTKINGLSDFNNLDREDFDDLHGDFSLTRYLNKRLWAFKKDRDGWIPVRQSAIVDQSGQKIIGLSDKLLNPIQYLEFDGGIGDNPESWYINEDGYQYHAMPMRGVFVRIAGDGIDAISKLYGFDSQSRAILNHVQKYKLRCPGGYDPINGDGTWSVKNYIEPIFSAQFVDPDWDLLNLEVPAGATPIIVSQPANGVVTIDGQGNFVVTMNMGFVGSDQFVYKFQYADLSFSPNINGCIAVNPPLPAAVSYRPRVSSVYCEKVDSSTFPNSFNIVNNSTSQFCGIPNIVFNSGTPIGGAAISAGSHDNIPCPGGGATSDLVINIGAGFTPHSAVMSASGMAPITGTITGSIATSNLKVTFTGIDCTTYHIFTVDLNP